MVSELLSAIEIRNAKSGDKPQVARWKRFKPAGASKADTARAVAVFTDIIAEVLQKGDSLSLVGFGIFERRAHRPQSKDRRRTEDFRSKSAGIQAGRRA